MSVATKDDVALIGCDELWDWRETTASSGSWAWSALDVVGPEAADTGACRRRMALFLLVNCNEVQARKSAACIRPVGPPATCTARWSLNRSRPCVAQPNLLMASTRVLTKKYV